MAASPTTAQQQATLSEAYGDQDGPPTSDSQSAAQPLGDDLRGDRDADNGNNDYARSDVGDSVKAENTRLGKVLFNLLLVHFSTSLPCDGPRRAT